jgi:hypothetical protein
LAPDTVTQQGKTDTEAELSHRLAKRSGIVAVPSIQVGVKCIGNSITKRSELFWLKSQDATVPLLACGDMLLSWGGAWRGGLDQLCSFDRGRRLCTDIHVFVWNLLAPTMVCRRRVCVGCAPHPPTPQRSPCVPSSGESPGPKCRGFLPLRSQVR